MDQTWNELDNFPKEILEHVIAFMEDDARLNARLANTKWFKLINYRQFHVRFITEETLPQVVDRLLQYEGPIGLKISKSRIKKLAGHVAHLSRLTNLTSLALLINYEADLPPHVWWGLTALTNLQELKMPFGCPVEVTTALINLKQLKINNDTVWRLSEGLKKMSRLDHLECDADITVPLDVYSMLPCPTRLTWLETNAKMNHTNTSKLYNLQSLKYDDANGDTPLQLSFDKFTALQRLEILQKHMSFGALPSRLTNLTISGVTTDAACYEHLARLHGLKELTLSIARDNDEHYSWISHMTSLASVSMWTRTNEEVPLFTGAMFSMINSPNLTELVLEVMPAMNLGYLSHLTTLREVFFYENDMRPLDVDYSFASHLTNLTNFFAYVEADRPSLTALTGLENLKFLRVNSSRYTHNHKIRLPAMSLARLTALEALWIEKCEPAVLESISGLTHLTALHTECLASHIDYEFLKDLPLQDLYVSTPGANGENFYSVLVQLTGLQKLNIQDLSARQVIGLSALQHLTSLNVFQCELNNGHNVTHLTSIQELFITQKDTRISDSAQLIETKMSRLVALRIS